MSRRTAEYVVSVAFADILEGYDLNASPHPQLQSGEPDVFVRDGGVRVVIELKKSGSGQKDALLSQMADRLEDGMGEVAFGVLFPSEIVEAGVASPTVSQVKDDLYDSVLNVWVATGAAKAVDPGGGFTARIGDFTDLVPRFTGELLAGEQLDDTVELVEETAHGFVANLLDLENPESIARAFESALEGLGEAARDDEQGLSDEEVQEYLVSGGLILFNATAFYGLLSQSQDLRSIRSRQNENDGVWSRSMREAFLDALEINYVSVFLTAERIIEELPQTPAVNAGLEEIHEAAEAVLSRAGLLRQDLTGRVYHSTLGRTLAKNYATYYTKIPSGELLAWLGLQRWDAKVGEFACGSGTLVTSSYHRKMNLAFEMIEEGNDTARPQAAIDGYDEIGDIHRRFVEDDVWGLDAMSFAAHLTAVNLALQQPDVPFDSSHVYRVPVSRDGESRLGSLDLLTSSTVRVQTRIDGGDSLGAGRQSMAMTEVEELRVPKGDYDLVIMNPPFTRTDRAARILDLSKLNRILDDEFDERDYANTTRAGLAAPFTILGDQALDEGGRLALVVPSSLLSRETWQPVRDFLKESYHLEHVVINWAPGEPAFSEDTDLREVLVVARKLSAQEKNDGGDQTTLMTHIDEPIDFLQARLIGTDLNDGVNADRISIQRPKSEEFIVDGTTQLAEVQAAPKAVTEQTVDNWYRLVAFRDHDLLRLMLGIEGIISQGHTPYGLFVPDAFGSMDEIGEVMLYIKNVASAGYSYSDTEVAGGTHAINTSRFDKISAEPGDGKWIFDDPNESATEDSPVNEGQLLVMRKMNMWATMRVCAIATDDDVDISASVWLPVAVEPAETTDGEEYTKYETARMIATWLNSSFGMIPYIGYRAETEGAYGEWKTRQVRRITTLKPSKLTSEQADALLEAYDRLKDREWELLRTQLSEAQADESHPRRELDEAVAQALLVDEETNEGDSIDEIVDIDGLYEDFEHTLTLLGEVMS